MFSDYLLSALGGIVVGATIGVFALALVMVSKNDREEDDQ
jgi:hypothetical protein